MSSSSSPELYERAATASFGNRQRPPPTHPVSERSRRVQFNVNQEADKSIPHSLIQTDPIWCDSPWAQRLILALDGGEMWSLVSLITLDFLMEQIAHIEMNSQPPALCSAETTRITTEETFKITPAGHFLPCHYFDLIGGTSTGGLIAIMLGRMKMTAPQCIETFYGFQRIEKRPRFTNPLLKASTFSKLWQKRTVHWKIDFGGSNIEDTEFLGDLYSCQTIAFAVKDTQLSSPLTFRSFDDATDNHDLTTIGSVSRKLVASSSEAEAKARHKRRSSDFSESGDALLKELQSKLPDLHDKAFALLLSLGCDPEKIPNARLQEKKNSQGDHTFLRRCNVNPFQEGASRSSNKGEIEWRTRQSCKSNMSSITEYAQTLVKWRRQRAATTYWETFALGARYYCHRQSCGATDEQYETRESFLAHLRAQHEGSWAWTPSGVEQELDRGRRLGVV